MKYVTLTTVNDIYEAQHLTRALDEAGISSMEANEHINTILPHLRQGIQIRVKETDYEQATLICERAGPMHKLICPKCESNNFTYVGGENRPGTFIVSALQLLLGVAITKHVLIYRCSNCGTIVKVK
jgi:hypothetical protein